MAYLKETGLCTGQSAVIDVVDADDQEGLSDETWVRRKSRTSGHETQESSPLIG